MAKAKKPSAAALKKAAELAAERAKLVAMIEVERHGDIEALMDRLEADHGMVMEALDAGIVTTEMAGVSAETPGAIAGPGLCLENWCNAARRAAA